MLSEWRKRPNYRRIRSAMTKPIRTAASASSSGLIQFGTLLDSERAGGALDGSPAGSRVGAACALTSSWKFSI